MMTTFRIVRFLYRFFSGRPLDGVRRSNCSYLRRGTRAVGPTGHASRWAMLAGWQRQWVRIPCVFYGCMWVASWWLGDFDRVQIIACAAATLGILYLVRLVRRWRTEREMIQPLAWGLAELLHQEPNMAREWVHIPVSMRSDGRTFVDRIRVPKWAAPHRFMGRVLDVCSWIPQKAAQPFHAVRRFVSRDLYRSPEYGFVRYSPMLVATPTFRKSVAIALADKVHADLTLQWNTMGSRPHVRFRPTPRPPLLVSFEDMRKTGMLDTEGVLALGLTASGPETVNIDAESPHIGISCSTGAGKSTLTGSLMAQILHHGGQVTVLDIKRISLPWARDLPGVTYHRTVAEIHDGLIELGDECERRFDRADRGQSVGPRLLVAFEEMNMAFAQLIPYWQSIRTKEDPVRSPAIAAFSTIAFAGRQIQVNMICVAQRLDAKLGGGDVRENLGTRILGRATTQAWRMMAAECGPRFPAKSLRRGRMHVVSEGVPTEVQVAYWTDAELQAWAQSGPLTVPAGWSVEDKSVSDLRYSPSTVTLRQFSEIWMKEGKGVLSYGALRTAKHRDASFPAPLADGTWRTAELRGWASQRGEARLGQRDE